MIRKTPPESEDQPNAAESTIIGYDFLLDKPPVVPCMTDNAAFLMRYAHVLPVLMIANFLEQNPSETVDTTVLCQGYGVEPSEVWWSKNQETDASKAV